jgi:nitrogen regulatory protein P-II 1
MKAYKVNAFVPILALPRVEKALSENAIPGITVSKVKGYGDHMNFYSEDLLETHGRIEVFCAEDIVDTVTNTIKQAVGAVDSSKGFIAILPVEKMASLEDF